MTNEEAQELIAEIKEKFHTHSHGQSIHPSEVFYMTLAEKIITRFTNKPPIDGYTSHWSAPNSHGIISIKKALDGNYVLLFKDGHYDFSLDIHDLRSLRHNIDKMLQYLEADK